MSVAKLKIVPDIDNRRVKITVGRAGSNLSNTVTATVKDGTKAVATGTGKLDTEMTLSIPSPKLWSPATPFLYNLDIQVKSGATVYDAVSGYFGMRKVHVADHNGTRKIFVNNQAVFQMGPLDQGFWPDGLYTAPTDAALKWDLEQEEAFGFNMVRKHMKVEPQRWYYWADTLGLLVWQDMPRRAAAAT
jgi:beta-galactosidase/beta-glucuronidase